jgi:hypothetical protein
VTTRAEQASAATATHAASHLNRAEGGTWDVSPASIKVFPTVYVSTAGDVSTTERPQR